MEGNFRAAFLAADIFRLLHIDIGTKKVYDDVKEDFRIWGKMR